MHLAGLAWLIVALASPVWGASQPSRDPPRRIGPSLRILSRDRPPSGKGVRVSFQEEDAAADAQGGRSAKGETVLDCLTGRFQIVRFAVYPLAHLQGEPLIDVGPRPEWRTARPDTTLGRVALAVCGRSTPKAALASAPMQAASAPPPGHLNASIIPQPARTTMQTVGAAGGADAVAATRMVQNGALQAGLPVAPPFTPPDGPFTTAVAPRLSPAPPSAAPTSFFLRGPIASDQIAAPPADPTGSTGANVYVQVAAEKSRDEADRKLARATALTGRDGRIVRATVHGAVYYRVLIGPFEQRADAGRLCQALAKLSPGCFLRPTQ